MLYLWYINSLSNRNKIRTYATFKEYFQVVYSINALFIILTYSAIGNKDNGITI